MIVKAAISSPFSLTACVCLSAAALGRFEAEGGERNRGEQKIEVTPPLLIYSWFDSPELSLGPKHTSG